VFLAASANEIKVTVVESEVIILAYGKNKLIIEGKAFSPFQSRELRVKNMS
jgi:hypothetical protein